MINNRQQSGRRRGRGGQNGQRQQNGRPEMGNRIDNRARGNAPQLLEKYKTLARDAQQAGDRVLAEYYFQFADHYFRVLAESRARFEEANPNRPRQDYGDSESDGFDSEASDGDGDEGFDAPRESRPQQQPRQDRYQRDDRPRDDRAPREQNRDGQNRDGQNRDGQNREDRPARQDREPRQDRYQRDDRPRDDRPREDRPREERAERPRLDRSRAAPRARSNGSASDDHGDQGDSLPFDALPPAINAAAMEPVAGVEGEPVAVPKKRGRPKKIVEAATEE